MGWNTMGAGYRGPSSAQGPELGHNLGTGFLQAMGIWRELQAN